MIPPGVVSDRVRKLQTFNEQQPAGEQLLEQRESTTIGQEPQTASDGKGRTSKDRLPRQISSTLPQKEQRLSAVRGPKSRNTSSRPSAVGFHPRAGNGRTNSSRPSQNLRYSTSTELLPSDSFVTSYPNSADPSRTASTTEKCQDAMDMLEQYSISRPEGWFSDRGADTSDQIVQAKPTLSQICHSCGNPLGSRRYCSHCGHDSCTKCMGETRGLGHKTVKASVKYHAHSSIRKTPRPPSQSEDLTSERGYNSRATRDRARRRKASRFASEPETLGTPRSIETQTGPLPDAGQARLKPERKKTIAAPTEVSNSVKNNPFFMADRETKTEAPEPAITARSIQVERKPKLSDCLPDRLMSKLPRISHIQEPCSDAGCKATHTGHLPIRHSIGCITGRSMGAQVSQGNELDEIEGNGSQTDKKHAQSLRVLPPKSKLQMKIDQLYHHGQDLHNSQHIMEHLSAGVKTLEEKATDEKAGVALMEGSRLSVQSQPVADHSLSQEDTMTVKANLINHELSRDSAVQGETEPQPPNLSDYHRGDQHPSPKSHEPNDDTRGRGKHWAKPLPDSHGEGEESQEDHSGSALLSRTSSVKPKLDTEEPRRGLVASREGNDRIAPPARPPSLPYKGHDRTQLRRKVDKSSEQPRSQQLTPSNVESWRRELSSVKSRTPLPEKEKKEDCLNCNPSQYSSPKDANNTFQIFAEDEPKNESSNKQNTAANSSLPRLKVTDIEHSLALKNVEELMVKSHRSQEDVIEEPTNSRLVSIADDQPRKDSEISTLIYDPSPVMPYDHMCAWRARYMDLKSQINQLELESSYQPGGKSVEGAGPSYSQPHDDIGIEGLTIVVRLRGKDDLVIKTDLKEGLQEHMRQR
ncbi:hypothetical protein ACHAPU_005593 [Fusarium lateritium]